MAYKATSEREWWNAHSDLVDHIWSYDDYLSFYCADRIPDDEDQRYDSVLLHALLHHLPDNEKCRLLEDVARALVNGGCNMYEPLAPKSEAPWLPKLVERTIGTVFRLMYFLAQHLRLYENQIRKVIRTDWTMKSTMVSTLAEKQG